MKNMKKNVTQIVDKLYKLYGQNNIIYGVKCDKNTGNIWYEYYLYNIDKYRNSDKIIKKYDIFDVINKLKNINWLSHMSKYDLSVLKKFSKLNNIVIISLEVHNDHTINNNLDIYVNLNDMIEMPFYGETYNYSGNDIVLKNKFIVKILVGLIIIIATHLFLQSYVLFVEHSVEYPWQDKKYAYFDLKALSSSDNKKYYLSVFGFPYNRNWVQIKEYLKSEIGNYDSSEKNTIGNFYLGNLDFQNKGSIYVEIEKPQSFSKAKITDLKPRVVFENRNGTKSSIYFIGR